MDIYNVVFNQNYPLTWAASKVFTVFKKGPKLNPEIYRGISNMSAIAKLYDMIPSARFNLRYTPTLVAVQTNRGSEEHILTIRLLIGIARKTKQELYIAIIDYQKAYDKVNRRKLIEKVDRKGCGTMFLMAMQRYMLSIGTIGNKQFQTPSGVKQGGGSSCKAFTFYIDIFYRWTDLILQFPYALQR